MDVVENGKVGVDDGSLAWIKTITSRGELFISSICGDRRRSKCIAP